MQTRRAFIGSGIGLMLLPSVNAALGQLPKTPRQPAGPFYPESLPLDDDNDLTRVAGVKQVAGGDISDLAGRLLDANGRPVAATRIEIWQCDANGRYRHSRDRRETALDPGFQGHGHTYSDAHGRYRFRTIRPVPYPGRAPHIHVAVFPQGERPFVTQLYIAGEPRNQRDLLFMRVPAEQRGLLLAEFKPVADSRAQYRAVRDLVLGSNTLPGAPT